MLNYLSVRQNAIKQINQNGSDSLQIKLDPLLVKASTLTNIIGVSICRPSITQHLDIFITIKSLRFAWHQ